METCTKTNKRRGERSSEAGLMMKRVEALEHVEKWAVTSSLNTCSESSGR